MVFIVGWSYYRDKIKKKSMKWDFKIVVLLVEWSSFRGGLKAGFYCIIILVSKHNHRYLL